MDLIQLKEIVVRGFFFILVTVMLAVTVTGVIGLAMPDQYQAKAVLRLGRSDLPTGVNQLDYNSLMMYRQLARTYGEWAVSQPILQKLAGENKNALDTMELREMVQVRKVKDLELLEIVVTDSIPERAAYLANSLAFILQQEEKKAWNMNSLQVIVPALPDSNPAGPNLLFYMVTAGLAGLILSVFLLAIVESPAEKKGQL